MKNLKFLSLLLTCFSCFYMESNCQTDIKILTPLGNQLDNSYPILYNTWSDTVIEQCNQAWLYGGGLFKKDSGSNTFTEKNNYLANHKVQCMDINCDTIFIGTDNGIYLSTDYGNNWLTHDSDGINNLESHKINAVSIRTNKFFACTDSGLHVSTDNGVTWEQLLASKDITCIEFAGDDTIYAGVSNNGPGVYKSVDNGESWDTTGLKTPVFCLKYDAPDLFAGTEEFQGLKKTTNGGLNWNTLYSLDKVTSIFIDSSNIYIGTDINGCLLSTNGGGAWVAKNNNFPAINTFEYYKLNSLQKFDGELYAATEDGLYKTAFQAISWSDCGVEDYYFRSGTETEKLTKLVYIDYATIPYQLWVVSWGEQKWKSASMISDRDYPLNPSNFPNYLCHTFAWHLSEGGDSSVLLPGPNAMRYIPWGADSIGWGKDNWDYIQTVWSDSLWEKVTYDWAHSGIKSLKNNPDISHEDSLIIESKWFHNGPLVEHKLRDYPYEEGSAIRYWKSKKVVSGIIDTITRIGRQIITDGVTTVPDGDTVDFYVAPMKEHKIQLKPGFHAERGCTFHAFVKDYYIDSGVVKPCKIPWEEEQGKIDMHDILANKYDIISTNAENSDNETSFLIKSSETTSKYSQYQRSDTIPCAITTDPNKYSGKGSGTEENPYQITTIYQFDEMASGLIRGELYWILMNDIDASETRYWNPVVIDGDTLFYRGFGGILATNHRSLDGRGHVIRNLYKFSESSRMELFSNLNCFSIKRLGFENLLFEGKPSDLLNLGHKTKDFIMEECYITGKMKGTLDYRIGSAGIGGLYNGAIVRNCYTDLTLISDSMVTNFSIILSSDEEAVVSNCYAVGEAISPKVNSPFGHEGNVNACFWDNEKIKITEPLGKGLGLPTSEMKKRSTFESAGWDFEKIWYIDEGMDYPKLRAFKKDTTGINETTISNSIEISPNPAYNLLNIKFISIGENPASIAIKNTFGIKVLEKTSNIKTNEIQNISFDLTDLPSGVYFCTLSSNGYIETKQFVVIK